MPAASPEWVQLVRDLGFPIALVIYLLVRFDKLLVQVRDALRELTHELKHFREKD